MTTLVIKTWRTFALIASAVILAGCGRAANKSATVYYGSNDDAFGSWTRYATGNVDNKRVDKIRGGDGAELRLASGDEGHVGANRALGILKGMIEFEYSVRLGGGVKPNIFAYAIPMADVRSNGALNEIRHPGEQGGGSVGRLRASASLAFEEGQGGVWRSARLDFDFRTLDRIHYTILAFRINEGSDAPSAGEVSIRNVRVFAHEEI